MSPQMVARLREIPEVLDVREVPLWSMQPEFWRDIADKIAEASMTEGCEFVLWGPQNRYGNCPVRCYEASRFADVSYYCQGLRPEVTDRDTNGRPTRTLWKRPEEATH